MGVTGDKPRPDLPQQNATDAQKAATWGPFNVNAGIYEVKGTTFTFRAIVGKNPNGMAPGSFQTGEIKVEGNTLTLTWKATNTGPITNPVTVKLTRLE